MNDRKRLIELLLQDEAITEYNTEVSRLRAEHKADRLLANGVLCPPCKVGDTVYVISESRVKEAEIDEIHRSRNDAKLFAGC